ncbi:t-SNARE domain containing protein 1, partial [Dissostichus eleginoides]
MQQQTNKVITSTSQLIKQLSDIISSSSRQDRLHLTRLKTELSESVQRYGDLQKKIAERSRALLPPAQRDKKRSEKVFLVPFCELEWGHSVLVSPDLQLASATDLVESVITSLSEKRNEKSWNEILDKAQALSTKTGILVQLRQERRQTQPACHLQEFVVDAPTGKLPPLTSSDDIRKHCYYPSPQTQSTEQIEEVSLFGEAVGSDEGAQAFLSEISEEDVEVLHQREEALLQIEPAAGMAVWFSGCEVLGLAP